MMAPVGEDDMRATWDELAGRPAEVYVGDPSAARRELDDLFGRLGADPRGGLCVEIGCGPGRMTGHLAERFDRVLALDVSPAMLERARLAVSAPNVEFRRVSGESLDGVADACADAVVCYLVLQHMPRRRVVLAYLREIGRVLDREGEAFVQLPVLRRGLAPRAWRALRGVAVPALSSFARDAARRPAFRGVRITARELEGALADAGLRVVATDVGPDAPYRHSVDRFLRLRRR
jgi:SAM-dependent methyltransferase